MRKGIWGGVICGTALQTLVLIIVLYRTNWNKGIIPGLNLDMESLHATSKSLFMTPILLFEKCGCCPGGKSSLQTAASSMVKIFSFPYVMPYDEFASSNILPTITDHGIMHEHWVANSQY